jgi:hypothetical protein
MDESLPKSSLESKIIVSVAPDLWGRPKFVFRGTGQRWADLLESTDAVGYATDADASFFGAPPRGLLLLGQRPFLFDSAAA